MRLRRFQVIRTGYRTGLSLLTVSLERSSDTVRHASSCSWFARRRRSSRSARSFGPSALFGFRPVLRNRSAMAYAIVYGIHTLEMSALRGWGVAYLAFVDVGNVAFPQLDRRCGVRP